MRRCKIQVSPPPAPSFRRRGRSGEDTDGQTRVTGDDERGDELQRRRPVAIGDVGGGAAGAHAGGVRCTLRLLAVVLVTVTGRDNCPNRPGWERLPADALWVGPSRLGLPLLARAQGRHADVAAGVRATARALAAG